jgi:hypothetical protein
MPGSLYTFMTDLFKRIGIAVRTSKSPSAASGDVLGEDGKQQSERGVAQDDLAGDDQLPDQGLWFYIAKTERRIGNNREIIGRKPVLALSL